ncbi:hypothetical protein BT63DRAFT_426226 [Microthyrium microscopicum]|uniref:FR47-like domain-containing protein n=1 Tax=Microthyrium microscopicum TaxID=703497 RepID=A0A6A6U8W4_9PEZI|nr:hypothetical protein BT63DRAFT_426226 [Microthyrium microscopicum]
MPTQIYAHPLDGSTTLPLLRDLLPESIALYGRIQHNFTTPSAILLATFPPSTTPPNCFAITFLDRALRPETEAWTYSSIQSNSSSTRPSCPPNCPSCRHNILTIYAHIANLPIPTSIHAGQTVSENSEYASHYSNNSILLAGSIDERVKDILADVLSPEHIALAHTPYIKYIVPLSNLPADFPLPDGLSWGTMNTPADVEFVRERSSIPRQSSTLARLTSVAIWQGERPIAWAYSGVDGSLVSLHVEEDWRGQGLAKMLSVRLMRMDVEEMGLGHVDVDVENLASRMVCESIGGVQGGIVYWVRIHLDRVVEILGDLENLGG